MKHIYDDGDVEQLNKYGCQFKIQNHWEKYEAPPLMENSKQMVFEKNDKCKKK